MGEKFCSGFFGHRWEEREFELTTIFGKVGVFLKYKQRISDDSKIPAKVTTIPLSVCYFRECTQRKAKGAANEGGARDNIMQLQYPSREGRVIQNSFTSLSFGTNSVRTLTIHFENGVKYVQWVRK